MRALVWIIEDNWQATIDDAKALLPSALSDRADLTRHRARAEDDPAATAS